VLECRGCALRRVWQVECLVQKRWNWNLNIEESELELEVSGIVSMSRTFAAVGWPQEPRFVGAFEDAFCGRFYGCLCGCYGAPLCGCFLWLVLLDAFVSENLEFKSKRKTCGIPEGEIFVGADAHEGKVVGAYLVIE